jgi:hypothetical protein
MNNTDQTLNAKMEALRKEKDQRIAELVKELEAQRVKYETIINDKNQIIEKRDVTILTKTQEILSLQTVLAQKTDVEKQLAEAAAREVEN